MTTYIPDALRRIITRKAQESCEYCGIHMSDVYYRHEIDHIYAEKHGGKTVEDNLCLACADCNRNKGADLCSLDEVTGQISALFHPRNDRWDEHFALVDGLVEPQTVKGRVTVQLLKINQLDRVLERARLIRLGRYPKQNP